MASSICAISALLSHAGITTFVRVLYSACAPSGTPERISAFRASTASMMLMVCPPLLVTSPACTGFSSPKSKGPGSGRPGGGGRGYWTGAPAGIRPTLRPLPAGTGPRTSPGRASSRCRRGRRSRRCYRSSARSRWSPGTPSCRWFRGKEGPGNREARKTGRRRPDREARDAEAAGRWPQAAGHWPQAAGDWPQAAGHWPQAAGHWPQAAGHWKQAAGHWPQVAGRHRRTGGHPLGGTRAGSCGQGAHSRRCLRGTNRPGGHRCGIRGRRAGRPMRLGRQPRWGR